MSFVTIPQQTTDPLPEASIDVMIKEVADLVGASDDPELKEKALRCLNRSADRMSLRGVFLYQRTYEDFTGFTSGQSYLTLPAVWGFPTDPIEIRDGSNHLLHVGEWKSYGEFRQMVFDTDHPGVPLYFTILSEQDGKIYLYPTIDPSSVGTIRVPYVKRISRPGEVNSLYVTPEARECLIIGAQWMFLQARKPLEANIWLPYRQDFLHELGNLKARQRDMEGDLHWGARPDEYGASPSPYSPHVFRHGSVYIRL